jgi:hypothetical protein
MLLKSKTEFSKRTKNGKEGLQANCKVCNREYRLSRKEQERLYRKGYRKRNPVQQKNKHLKYSYGITFDKYQDLVLKQEGVCAICKNITDVLVVDHDHTCCNGPKSCSKCIRGLLCRQCNLGLGYFKDNKKYLETALEYLKRVPDEE